MNPLMGEPDTLGWAPGLDNTTKPYTSEPRLNVQSFHPRFMELAKKMWKYAGVLFDVNLANGNRVLKIRVKEEVSGEFQFVDWDGTSIDHCTPVKTIAEQLYQKATLIQQELTANKPKPPDWVKRYYGIFQIAKCVTSTKNGKKNVKIDLFKTPQYVQWPTNENDWSQLYEGIKMNTHQILPTQYAAKTYYHDFDNLGPMLSRQNSGKGARTALNRLKLEKDSKTMLDLEQIITKVHLDLQLVIKNWGITKLDKNVLNYIKGIKENLGKLVDFLETVLQDEGMASPQAVKSIKYDSPQRVSRQVQGIMEIESGKKCKVIFR